MKKYACLLVALLTTLVGRAQLLWEVSGNGLRQPSYLFGTYHVLKSSYLDGTPAVRTAYDKAEGVVVEMVVDSSLLMQVAMRGLMPGKNLAQLLPADDYKLVADEFRRATGMELSFFNMMKPIVTATVLSLAYAEKESDTLKRFTGKPLDLYFADEGRRRGKSVNGLETMEEQISLLYDHDPVEKQAEQLAKMVKARGKARQMSRDLTGLYLAGDLAKLGELMAQEDDAFGDMTYLLDERNQNWMKRLPALMASKPQFIAVGAGHLPGKNGLLALLKQAGYVVKPIDRKTPAAAK